MTDVGNFSENLYQDYHAWKGWDNLFRYTADHAGYYAHELYGLQIAGADVLEIGFGSGTCLAWMADAGARITGAEISERSCSAARARGIELLAADLPSCASYNMGRFDTILGFDVFEHLSFELVSAYLAACEKLLRPGGKLLLRFPNAQSPFGLCPQAGDPTHCTQLSRAVIELLIAERGLRVVHYSGSYFYLGRPLTLVWAKRLLRRVAQIFIGNVLRFTFATDIPYDPVVVIVLERYD